MALSDVVNTFGQYLLRKYGEPVHKVAIDACFTCPNRDGSKGIGGCTFCNNSSFSPHGRQPDPITTQIDNGRSVIGRRTGAKKFLAYFQSYTNTYDDVALLKARYDKALAHEGVIGLSIGTRPDCVAPAVLDLLAEYHHAGHEVCWSWACSRASMRHCNGSIVATLCRIQSHRKSGAPARPTGLRPSDPRAAG